MSFASFASGSNEVVGESWQAPLVHGLLHLLGYEHGPEMSRREEALAP